MNFSSVAAQNILMADTVNVCMYIRVRDGVGGVAKSKILNGCDCDKVLCVWY
jgi:hypothetical protein